VREALPGGAVFGIKSGDVPGQGLLGFKAAGFWPANRSVGAERHQATIMLIDPASGRPVCIVDGNAVTTMRTGAAGGLGLQMLARADSRRLCLFGAGVQARVQLEFALATLAGPLSVLYLTSDGQPDSAFERHFAGCCELAHASDANAAVAGADVVITATPGRAALFDAAAVRPGTHLNCVGSDTRGKRELPEGLLARARIVVDDRAQAAQVGELQWAPQLPCDEIGALLGGAAPFVRAGKDITVFDMTGLALQDLTVARMLRERALDAGVGTRLAWPW
jgi:ornithine cyclodeaminase